MAQVKLTKKAREGADSFCALVRELDTMLRTSAETEKLSSFIKAVVEKSGLGEYHQDQDDIAGTQKSANLDELVNSAVLYPCSLDGLTAFLDSIQLDRTLASEHRDYIGKTLRVLVDGVDGDQLTARTDGGRLVRMQGDKELIGKFISATITDATTWSLVAEIGA